MPAEFVDDSFLIHKAPAPALQLPGELRPARRSLGRYRASSLSPQSSSNDERHLDQRTGHKADSSLSTSPSLTAGPIFDISINRLKPAATEKVSEPKPAVPQVSGDAFRRTTPTKYDQVLPHTRLDNPSQLTETSPPHAPPQELVEMPKVLPGAPRATQLTSTPKCKKRLVTVEGLTDQLRALSKDIGKNHAELCAYTLLTTKPTDRRIETGTDWFADLKSEPVREETDLTHRVRFKVSYLR
jgi:hypothetical protein